MGTTMHKFLQFVAFVACSLAAIAQADCIDDAAIFHAIDPVLLRAIAKQESRMNPTATHVNRDGSIDYGLMGINSSHLGELARFGITKEQLLDGCVNAYVGAWILQRDFHRLGVTTDALGAYNAASPDKRAAYVQQIVRRLAELHSAGY